MNIAIAGAGAIGTLLGVRLLRSGQNVCFIDQGAQLETLRKRGLTLIDSDGTESHIQTPRASDNAASFGRQDLVILAVKAHQLTDVAPKLGPLIDGDTSVMTVQNGLPWWYFQRHGGDLEGRQLSSLDPTGRIGESIDSRRIVGCVAYPAAATLGPGVVRHVEGNRFTLGELDNAMSTRCQGIADALIAAGFKSYVIDNIRAELWLKAWGALSFNAISALTRATMEDICRFPLTRELAADMMREAQSVANKLGIEFRHTIARRIEGAEQVGPHKTSMLQDVERGTALEVDALLGSIIELAEATATPVPLIRSIYACCKLLDSNLGTGDKRVAMQDL